MAHPTPTRVGLPPIQKAETSQSLTIGGRAAFKRRQTGTFGGHFAENGWFSADVAQNFNQIIDGGAQFLNVAAHFAAKLQRALQVHILLFFLGHIQKDP